MPDNPTNSDLPEKGTSEGELNLTEVVEIAPDSLSEEQKTFLEEHKTDLTPEQAEKFGIELEEKPEEIDVEKVEVETRTKEPEEKPEEKGEEEEEEEVAPEDRKAIGQVVDDKLTDFRGKLEDVDKVKDQVEVDAYIRDNPDFGVYRGVMLKYLAHPAYKNIPVKNIAAIVGAADLQKLGAKKEREAAQKAKETQGGGTTVRKGIPTGIDWHTASKEEFEKKKAEVMGRPGN